MLKWNTKLKAFQFIQFQFIHPRNLTYNLYHGPPKPTFLEVFMVNNLVLRWPKPLFFMVLEAHGRYQTWPLN